MTDHRSTVPPFTVAGVTFVCWVVDDGVNDLGLPATRYVWRSTCGRFAAGHRYVNGRRLFWARGDGEVVGAEFPTRKFAMGAAVGAAHRSAA